MRDELFIYLMNNGFLLKGINENDRALGMGILLNNEKGKTIEAVVVDYLVSINAHSIGVKLIKCYENPVINVYILCCTWIPNGENYIVTEHILIRDYNK